MTDQDLVTRCPNCDTTFRITRAQLGAAGGAVRCGACLSVFHAPDHLMSVDEQQETSPDIDTSGDWSTQTGLIDSDEPARDEGDEASVVAPDGFTDEAQPDRAEDDWREDAGAGDEPARDESVDLETEEIAGADDNLSPGTFNPQDDQVVRDDAIDREDDEEMDSMEEAPGADMGSVLRDDEFAGESRFDVGAGASGASGSDPQDGGESPDAAENESKDGSYDTGRDGLPDFASVHEEFGDGRFDGDLDIEPDTVEIVEHPEPRPIGRRVIWGLGAVALLVLLAGQVLWFNRNALSQDPELRGYFEQACRLLPCELPPYSDINALHTTNLVVRSNPGVSNALVVDAIIRNDAPWPQRFPRLVMKFSDIHNRMIAARTFSPDEYLGGELTGLKFIPARTEVRISLEIVDPGPDATNYSLLVRRQ